MNFIINFFKTLNDNNIRYVHWKSNLNIEKALSGIDDLDILVSPNDRERLFDIFERLNILKADSYKDNWQSGITHYIGYDTDSISLVHVHLHFELSLGYDFDKYISLPIVEEYIDSRTLYNNIVYIPSFEMEYIILVIRLVLKNSLTPFLLLLPHQQLKLIMSSKEGIIKGNAYKEYIDLKSKISVEDLKISLNNKLIFLNKEIFEDCERIINNNNSISEFIKIGLKLEVSLKNYAYHSRFKSLLLSSIRLFSLRFKNFNSRLGFKNSVNGKINVNGGRIFAFVGGDGAGKSTTIENTYKLLKKQFSVEKIHIGRPRKHFYGVILLILSKFFGILKLRSYQEIFSYLSIANNRRSEFRYAKKLRKSGVIVLQDRMPLKNITHMDSHKIYSMKGGDYKYFSEIEKKCYEEIKDVDSLFILKLNPEIALQRRPEDEPNLLRLRSGEIWNGNWDDENMVIIDTGENNEHKVLTIIGQNIWKNLLLKG